MALIKCSECGREISDSASSCPGCGAPMVVAKGLPAAWVASQQESPPQPVQPPASSVGAGPKPGVSPRYVLLIIIVCFTLYMVVTVKACGERSGQSLPVASAPAAESKLAPAPAPDPTAVQKNLEEWATRMESEETAPAVRLNLAESIISNYGSSPEAARARELLAKLQEGARLDKKRRAWSYTYSPDPMSSKDVVSASIGSENTLEFDFPYAGPQRGRLTLRKHPRWGSDVMVSVERGQILCSSYSCPVRVRFDDGPTRTLTGNEAADNSSELLFVPGFNDFHRRLIAAKKLRIEVNVHQEGAVLMEFDVEGFDPAKLK